MTDAASRQRWPTLVLAAVVLVAAAGCATTYSRGGSAGERISSGAAFGGIDAAIDYSRSGSPAPASHSGSYDSTALAAEAAQIGRSGSYDSTALAAEAAQIGRSSSEWDAPPEF